MRNQYLDTFAAASLEIGWHPGKLAPLEREIAATDAEMDELAYKLYGITEEDRKIVEQS